MAGVAVHDSSDLRGRKSRSIRAILRECAVDVGDGDEASLERKICRMQVVGVAGAVKLLVVLSRDGGELGEEFDAGGLSQFPARQPLRLASAFP